MRKILVFTAIITMMVMASSCGSSKKAAAAAAAEAASAAPQTEAPQKKWKSEAQLYAEDPDRTNMRAWAQFNGFPEDRLESAAITLARAELAKSISVLVKTSYKDFTERFGSNTRDAGENAEQNRKMALINSSAEGIESVASEVIKGSRVVMSDRYVEKNGTETAYVCVEIPLETVIDEIQNNSLIKDIFTEGMETVDKREEKLRVSLKNAFEELKNAR